MSPQCVRWHCANEPLAPQAGTVELMVTHEHFPKLAGHSVSAGRSHAPK